MSNALEQALVAAGLAVRVEARDRLAILTPCAGEGEPDLTSEPLRRVAIALASEGGFTHVALELLD